MCSYSLQIMLSEILHDRDLKHASVQNYQITSSENVGVNLTTCKSFNRMAWLGAPPDRWLTNQMQCSLAEAEFWPSTMIQLTATSEHLHDSTARHTRAPNEFLLYLSWRTYFVCRMCSVIWPCLARLEPRTRARRAMVMAMHVLAKAGVGFGFIQIFKILDLLSET